MRRVIGNEHRREIMSHVGGQRRAEENHDQVTVFTIAVEKDRMQAHALDRAFPVMSGFKPGLRVRPAVVRLQIDGDPLAGVVGADAVNRQQVTRVFATEMFDQGAFVELEFSALGRKRRLTGQKVFAFGIDGAFFLGEIPDPRVVAVDQSMDRPLRKPRGSFLPGRNHIGRRCRHPLCGEFNATAGA